MNPSWSARNTDPWRREACGCFGHDQKARRQSDAAGAARQPATRLDALKICLTPPVLLRIVKQGIVAFGMFIAGAVAWQRVVSILPILLSTAVLDLRIVAGCAAGIANCMMTRASVHH